MAKKSTIFTKSWDNCIYPSYLHTSNCNLNLGYLQSHIGHSLKQKSLGYLKHHTMSLHRYQRRHSESSSGHQSPPYRRSISWSDDEPPRHTRMRERRKRRRAHSTDQVSTGFTCQTRPKSMMIYLKWLRLSKTSARRPGMPRGIWRATSVLRSVRGGPESVGVPRTRGMCSESG